MGLDVYLYRYDRGTPFSDEEQEKIDAGAPDYPSGLSGEAHAAAWKLWVEASNEYRRRHGCEKIERDSAVYPAHMFKVGYLRSSYNSGGINNKLREMDEKKDLYYIFEPGDRYEFQPDWGACLKRAREVRDLWIQHTKSVHFRIVKHGINGLAGLQEQLFASEADALKATVEAFKAPRDANYSAWSNLKGMWSFDPLPVRGIVFGRSPLGELEAWMICDAPEDDEHIKYYREALEITVEMCEWVLGQENPQQFWMRWSS
jgi:hypothetical protein